ncbi:MAG: carbohydrate kinase family protein [Patescibacteria group bacterium]
MNKKIYDVISLGGATRDITFYTDEGQVIDTPEDLTRQKLIGFEYGAKMISDKVYFGLGGGGCNTSVSFARLGLRNACWITVGNDREGDSIINDLKDEGVDTKYVQRNSKLSTGFSFITIAEKSKDHVAFLYRGSNNASIFPKNAAKILKTQWLYVSSLTGKTWLNNAHSIVKFIKESGTKLGWNPGETQLKAGKKKLSSVLKVTDVLFINKDEAIELVLSAGMIPKQINNARVLTKIIQGWGPKIVVITDGRKGAYVYDGKNSYYSKVIDRKVVDTTGAGDCFGSSFVAGMVHFNGNIEKAVRLCMLNTASLVQKTGAQNGLIYWRDVKNKFTK